MSISISKKRRISSLCGFPFYRLRHFFSAFQEILTEKPASFIDLLHLKGGSSCKKEQVQYPLHLSGICWHLQSISFPPPSTPRQRAIHSKLCAAQGPRQYQEKGLRFHPLHLLELLTKYSGARKNIMFKHVIHWTKTMATKLHSEMKILELYRCIPSPTGFHSSWIVNYARKNFSVSQILWRF